ncbi:MAG: cation transporting ATPase C-terminal domain-containing protein, partial [Clostridiales Family XIII bacterium]|nr:cation transporting ATPase C-terminal domain-containing protein [Clostridiales Family XIII bacterium]
ASIFGEILTIFTAILASFVSPLNALQILWLNMLTDSIPALALGVDHNESDVMHEKPRETSESFFAKGGMFWAVIYGIIISLVSLCAFLYNPILYLIENGDTINLLSIKNTLLIPQIQIHSQTYAFITICFSQVFTSIAFKDISISIFKMKHLKNKVMLIAILSAFALQIIVVSIPIFNTIFTTTPLSLIEWLSLILFSSIPIWVHELVVMIKRNLYN